MEGVGVLQGKALLLLLLCIIFGNGVVVNGKGKSVSIEREREIEKKLKQLNRPAVKTIQSEDGDIIDCVDIHKQPAFDHPLLRNHTIQLRPSDEVLKIIGADSSSFSSSGSPEGPIQTWQKSGRCPEGTIPMLRVERRHLLNTSSIKNYGKKPWHGVTKQRVQTDNQSINIEISRLHQTGVLVAQGFSYIGSKANLNLWRPYVAAHDEYSSSQIWMRNGPFSNADSLETGWIVYPDLYDDSESRLFVYWTTDSGQSTGCFNLMCPGFVQTNHDIVLGSRFSPVSTDGGPQYQITLTVTRDYEKSVWWLVYGKTNQVTIGYWPVGIFRGLSKVATVTLFGGDVYSPRMTQRPHTDTDMGSGKYPTEKWSHASFVSEARIMDYSKSFKFPDPAFPSSMHDECYGAIIYGDDPADPIFYFGGPGRNDQCP